MKAIVYSGHGWSWCDRVKVLLTDNDYEIEERILGGAVMKELEAKYDRIIRTVPQVIIDDALIGGYNEVESLMRGTTSINKV